MKVLDVVPELTEEQRELWSPERVRSITRTSKYMSINMDEVYADAPAKTPWLDEAAESAIHHACVDTSGADVFFASVEATLPSLLPAFLWFASSRKIDERNRDDQQTRFDQTSALHKRLSKIVLACFGVDGSIGKNAGE